MKNHIEEWIQKATLDIGSAKVLLESKAEYYDQVCFLCQQAIEKLLKAYLVKNNAEISKTHDLLKLLVDCSKYNEEFLNWKNVAISLTTYAVDFRYPGETALKEEALDSYKFASDFLKFLMKELLN